jgi:carboxyl-terminal processing protease
MGLDLRVIEHRVVVTNVHADTPAAAAHVQRGWIVQRVDGADPMEHQGEHAASGPMARYARDAAAQALDLGSAGSTETWTFLDASGTAHTLSLQRAETSGTPTQIGLLPTFRVRCEDRLLSADELHQMGLDPKLRIAVIGFNIWMPVIATQFDEAVDRHRDCDGIILDLRGNPGGVGAMAMGIAGHFHDDTDSLGTMRTREASLEFKVNPRRSTADGRSVRPFAGPLAILVDPLSASTSEIFAAGLQSLDRAHVVGRTSAGAALPAQMRELPGGDGLLFAFADFTRPDGSHIEGVGVIPDLPSGDTLLAWQLGNDPDIAAAADWIAVELHPFDCH